MLKLCLSLLLVCEGFRLESEAINTKDNKSDFSYFVQLARNRSNQFIPFCDGIIIANDWILTAANCVFGKKKDDIRVITGGKLNKLTREFHKISNLTIHEEYSYIEDLNDIALIKLQDSLKLNSETNLIKIRSTPLQAKEMLEILVLTSLTNINPFLTGLNNAKASELQTFEAPVMSESECQMDYIIHFPATKITNNTLCVNQVKKYACNGIGPAVDSTNGELVGILSIVDSNIFQVDSCTARVPYVFTNVINYRDWIKNTTTFDLDNIN